MRKKKSNPAIHRGFLEKTACGFSMGKFMKGVITVERIEKLLNPRVATVWKKVTCRRCMRCIQLYDGWEENDEEEK